MTLSQSRMREWSDTLRLVATAAGLEPRDCTELATLIDQWALQMLRLERFADETVANAQEDARMAEMRKEPVVSGLIAAAHGDGRRCADVVSLASRRGQPRLCALGPCDGEKPNG